MFLVMTSSSIFLLLVSAKPGIRRDAFIISAILTMVYYADQLENLKNFIFYHLSNMQLLLTGFLIFCSTMLILYKTSKFKDADQKDDLQIDDDMINDFIKRRNN